MKKSFLKVVSVLAATLMACLVMSACIGKKPNSYTSVVMWHYYNGSIKDAFDTYITEFNNTVGLAKGIVIDAISKGKPITLEDELMRSAKKELKAEPLPNITMAYADTAYMLDLYAPLAHLEKYFTQKELDEYVPAYINGGYINDSHLKVFPIAKASEVLTLNRTDWDVFHNAVGESNASINDFKTIEGVVRQAKKYKAWSGKAMYSRDAIANYFYTGLAEQGKPIYKFDASGNATLDFDKAAVKKLWDNYYIPYMNGEFSHNNNYVTDCIKNGETIAGTGSTTSSGFFPTKAIGDNGLQHDIELMVLPAPVINADRPFYIQQGAGMCVFAADSATEKACAEFLKWFTEKDRNIDFSLLTGYMPVKLAANNFETISKRIDDDTPKGVVDTIRVSFGMIASAQKLYQERPCKNSVEVRKILDGLAKKCKEDYKKIADLEKSGKTDEAKLERDRLVSERNFDEWYNKTKANILQALAG